MKSFIDHVSGSKNGLYICRNEPSLIFDLAYKALFEIQNTDRIIFLRGSRMLDFDRMLEEVSASFQFPYYFGNNIPALIDCLTDLGWMPGRSYTTVIYEADKLLSESSDSDLSSLFSIIDNVERFWKYDLDNLALAGRSSTAFSVIFQVEATVASKFLDRLARVGVDVAKVKAISLAGAANDPS